MFEFLKKKLPREQHEINKMLHKEVTSLGYDLAFLKEQFHFYMESNFEVCYANDEAIFPTRSHLTDAGYDLYSPRNFTYYQFKQNLLKGRHTYVDTGVCINIKPGFVGLVCPRSSMSLRSLPCDLGVIDAGYQGSIKVLLPNPKGDHADTDVIIKRGDRIAQIIFLRLPDITLGVVSKFSDKSERGEGGLGSSGR